MPKLPQISGKIVIKLLHSLGYETLSQRGSHVKIRKLTTIGEHTVIVPLHKVVAKGTLNDILSKVSLWNNIPKEDLTNKLK